MDWDILTPSQPARLSINRKAGRWNSEEGWQAYFPEEADTELIDSEAHRTKFEGRKTIVETLYHFFENQGTGLLQKAVEGKKTGTFVSSIFVDYRAFKKSCPIPDFENAICNIPEETIPCLSLAAIRFLEQLSEQIEQQSINETHDCQYSHTFLEALKSIPPVNPGARPWVRFYNLEQSTPLKDLKAAFVGKLVSVTGTVIRVSNIRQQVLTIPFICCRCGNEILKYLPDYKYCVPHKCISDTCKSKMFKPVRNRALTVDWQKIRIQEAGNETNSKEAGRMPRMIDIELTGDLIDSCHPGDVVSVCGIIKVLPVSGENGNRNEQTQKSLHHLYIDANSVIKGSKGFLSEENIHLMKPLKFRREDIAVFKKIAQEDDAFSILVKSLCPSIYGNDIIKAGLTLILFGGESKKDSNYQDNQSIRSDLHCLLVGDPGLGKSQMLKSICDLSPRGVYVSGNSSSAAGLTVTVVKEQGSGDYSLEAGALVLGDQGICCVDEFDKMRNEHQALLETMEQQRVSIAKAGILCSLSARTSVIAAANPCKGHYDSSKTISDNLRMSPQLLSRFDLIFLMLDKPHESKDRQLAEYVTSMHLKQSQKASDARRSYGEPGSQLRLTNSEISLTTRLEKTIPKDKLLSHSIFRRYVSFATSTIKPQLNSSAKKVLQELYLELRRQNKQETDPIPVTTRLLESLVRLTEARARSELRNEATEDDAKDVVEIMRHSIIATQGQTSSKLKGPKRASQAAQFKKFLRILQAEASRTSKTLFSNEDLKELGKRLSIPNEQVKELVERLNYEGFLIRKRDQWKLMTCDL
ncbi:hypothetical protein GpartN1_g2415.t1 [Galdieria partita]|uniref:DNA helicase n=1 Tax=Galdieria partita TaxID=83374 RepID=A0A9C7PUS7_9RHOD|nr:hypothetical protein GpartN1_g2415.t1 [Galdieria partita]